MKNKMVVSSKAALAHFGVIFLFVFLPSWAEAALVLKEDPITHKAALVEEGPSAEETAGKEGKDHVSEDVLPSDERFKQYTTAVDEAAGDMQQGLYEPAIEKLKEAIMLEPSMPYAYDNLANAYYHLRRYEEAIAMSKKALTVDPNYANAYGNLGSIYYALGKYQDAKENYEKARELFQKKGDARGVAKTDEYLAQSFLLQ